MQTLYYTTGNFIRHTGNVVDLTEYRRRLAQTEQEPEEAEEKIVLLPREIEPSPRHKGQESPPPGAVPGRLRQHGRGGDDPHLHPADAGPVVPPGWRKRPPGPDPAAKNSQPQGSLGLGVRFIANGQPAGSACRLQRSRLLSGPQAVDDGDDQPADAVLCGPVGGDAQGVAPAVHGGHLPVDGHQVL